MRRASALCLVSLVVALVSGCGGSGSAQSPSPAPSPTANPTPRTTLTDAERLQLTQLEARPLHLPANPGPGKCPDGPHGASFTPYASGAAVTDAYLNGPIYGEGGAEHDTAANAFYFVTYFTDPSVTGVVLSRGRDLATNQPVLFTGDYAVGPVVGTDVLLGFPITLHSELAIPADAKRPGQNAAPGWGIFPATQGVDKNWTCVAIQVDFATGYEVLTAAK